MSSLSLQGFNVNENANDSMHEKQMIPFQMKNYVMDGQKMNNLFSKIRVSSSQVPQGRRVLRPLGRSEQNESPKKA